MDQKKSRLYVFFLILIIGWIGTAVARADEGTALPVAGEEQVAAGEEDVADDILPEDEKPESSVKLMPRIAYNPIEKWRFGLEVTAEDLLGPDRLRIYGDYSFAAKKVNGGLEYRYHFGLYSLFGAVASNTGSFGLFDNRPYFQHERSVMLGGSRSEIGDVYFYVADLRAKLVERNPYQLHADQGFEAGTDLYVQPTVYGVYQGYQGKLKLNYSIPTDISDYSYLKVNALVQKSVQLTSNGRLIIAGEAGVLQGNYPNQVRFAIGSSPSNIAPNFWSKILNLGEKSEVSGEPFVYLQGYEDNAFRGRNMYVGRLEYQHRLFGKLPYGIYPVATVFTTFGNAFDGSWSEGLQNPKAALGVGFNIESVLESPGTQQNWYIGLHMAHGFGDKSAFTLGFETGMRFDLLPLLLMR